MATKPVNPITDKIVRLINSGRTTKEKICVAADLKYPSFSNIFKPGREKISTLIIQALLYAGIITQKDKEEYLQWLVDHGLNKEGRGGKRERKRKPNNGAQTTAMDQESEYSKQADGDKNKTR